MVDIQYYIGLFFFSHVPIFVSYGEKHKYAVSLHFKKCFALVYAEFPGQHGFRTPFDVPIWELIYKKEQFDEQKVEVLEGTKRGENMGMTKTFGTTSVVTGINDPED